MSYTIRIGEPEIEVDRDECAMELVVNVVSLPDAPNFPNDLTGNSNDRAPAYAVWDNWTRAVGLHDLFFGDPFGIMREHSGIFPLMPGHLTEG